MNELNPELEAQVKALSLLCCRKLDGESFDFESEALPLLQAMVRGGYSRLSKTNLQSRVEVGAVNENQEVTLHRHGELTALTGELQQRYDELVLWETRQAVDPQPPKAANISSATTS